MFPKSIRWRLQLWLGFLLVCILSGFGLTAYQLHRTNLFSQIDEGLGRQVAALSRDVRGPPPFDQPRISLPFGPDRKMSPPGRPGPGPMGTREGMEDFLESREIRLSPRTLSLFDSAENNGTYYGIWSRRGTLRLSSTNAPFDLAFPQRLLADTSLQIQIRGTRREAYQFTEIGECVLAGRSIVADLAALRRFAWLLLAAGGAVLALGLGSGWLLSSRALGPVEQIGVAASRISQGNLAERIDIEDTDSELGRLAAVLNSTFARLEAAFAQQKQFTTDASHELRTPIAVLISETQTTLARERTAAEYRATVEVCLDTAQQMKRLTHSLLTLARYDAGQETIERQRADLAQEARTCADLVASLARERGAKLYCDLSPALVLGDADRLRQVILNLLTNAIQYNCEPGEARITTRTENTHALLVVANTGQGISAEDLPHVFERFYRTDKSRSRPDGHWGLGLAISKAIVEAHGGSIQVTSQPGVATEFTLRLPRFDQKNAG
jgi:heavy metal sensor kinase